MKIVLRALCLSLAVLLCLPSFAQTPTNIILTEASDPDEKKPLDDIVEKRITYEKRVLPYEILREADIMWEKRIWRVIDIREKMNLPFTYPERAFFTILMEAAQNAEITTYSAEDDKFSSPLLPEEVKNMGSKADTIPFFDPITYEEKDTVVYNVLNHADVKRFRLKEVWFFDEESSAMQVRVLGIAPLLEEYDDNGNFLVERPLFWVYYPEAREVLAREPVFNMFSNDSQKLTWEDMFEMRFFSSYIYKESNVHDRRLQGYLSGVDLLLEADKIKNKLFNFEHDLWSY